MSRIGKKPILVPAGVDVAVNGRAVKVEGPKGQLTLDVHPDMTVTYDAGDRMIHVARPTDNRQHRALHGLTRSLVANMVEGVTAGYAKRLLIRGTGYNAKLDGKALVLTVGFSHPVRLEPPAGVSVELPNPTTIVISGCDKQAVGQFAADVRRVYPPEPYKQKGIRYEGEVVRKKAGKTFVGGAA